MNTTKPILVSACLLGTPCRYDGSGKADARLLKLGAKRQLIPVCPELLGGLPTPRPPAERVGARILDRSGADVTAAYLRGAQETLRLARLLGCKTAILKARSPSCGAGQIYDGTFSGTLVAGQGITAALLTQNGVTVFTEESDLSHLL